MSEITQSGKVVRTIEAGSLKLAVIEHDRYTFSSVVSRGVNVLHECFGTTQRVAFLSAASFFQDLLKEVDRPEDIPVPIIAVDKMIETLEGGAK